MAKFEPGLHKKVSTIFDGVPIPKDDNTPQPPSQPQPQIQPQPQPPTASEKESPASAPVKPFMIEQLLSLSSQQTTNQPQEKVSSEQPAVEDVENIRWWKQIENKIFPPKPGVDVGKQKKMAILMSVLFVVFIFVIIHVLKQFSPAPANTQGPAAAKADSTAAVSEDKINWKIPEQYPAEIRDPMKPGLPAGEGSGNLIVKGIVYSDNPSAVVGGKIVHQGEQVLGVTVVKINKSSIEFEMNGRKWTQEVQR